MIATEKHQPNDIALGYRTPMAHWREGTQATKTVDMIDNANALTTCPQQQQQTQSLAA